MIRLDGQGHECWWCCTLVMLYCECFDCYVDGMIVYELLYQLINVAGLYNIRWPLSQCLQLKITILFTSFRNDT